MLLRTVSISDVAMLRIDGKEGRQNRKARDDLVPLLLKTFCLLREQF